MPHFKIQTPDQVLEFDGKVIGTATSEDEYHNHQGDFVPRAQPGQRKPSCSACRWFEVTLYRTDAGEYVAYTNGRSIVPGEVDFPRLNSTDSAYELVDLLTVRRETTSFLPAPSSRALAQAAKDDEEIKDAYINRAVV